MRRRRAGMWLLNMWMLGRCLRIRLSKIMRWANGLRSLRLGKAIVVLLICLSKKVGCLNLLGSHLRTILMF